MPETEVLLFTEEDGSCPFIEWLDGQPPKVQDKCLVRIERLAAMGHELRRPEADYLRDGIYELRLVYRHVNYRILYFFHSRISVVSHGFTKEDRVPDKYIDLARSRLAQFAREPDRHTYEEQSNGQEGED